VFAPRTLSSRERYYDAGYSALLLQRRLNLGLNNLHDLSPVEVELARYALVTDFDNSVNPSVLEVLHADVVVLAVLTLAGRSLVEENEPFTRLLGAYKRDDPFLGLRCASARF